MLCPRVFEFMDVQLRKQYVHGWVNYMFL